MANADEAPAAKVEASSKGEESSPIYVTALRHAGEVIPGLWVGDIRSVSFIEDLVRLSIKRHLLHNRRRNTALEEQKMIATVTVISVMSSDNLLKYVADSLEEKRKLYQHQKQVQNADQQHLREECKVKCNVSALKDEDAADNIVPDCVTESNHKLTLSESIEMSEPCFADLNQIKFDHVKVPLRDSLDSDLMAVLSETLDKIHNALGLSDSRNLGTLSTQSNSSLATLSTDNDVRICLVHCAKGASRSVSIVIGYLLSRYPKDFPSFDAALRHVRMVRPRARPNVKFAVDLRRYAKQIHK